MSEPADTGVNRRELLETAGVLAAGGVLLAAASDSAAAQVEDRGSTVRITGIRGMRVGTKAYVKIETNRNIVGWGEVTGSEPTVAAALAEAMRELLVDENPTRIEHLWQKIYRSHRDMRGGPFMTHVLSAIDMALWDITGKLWGVPVYRLLGGPTRDKVRMYPTPRAQKLGTGGPHPFSGNPSDIQGLVRHIQETRKRLGPDATIMFDAHCAVPPPMLIQLAAAIQPYDILFLEEPAVPGNIEVFKRLQQQIRIPMATGERDRTIWGMIPYLQERCIDILQPDVGHTGGITQMKKIATLAEAYFVPLAPHCTCSELGLSASIHVAASIPLFLIQEGYLDGHIMPAGVARKSFTLDKNGDAGLPQGPGLGVEIDESQFAKVNADPKRRFRWPTPTYADGSVRDY
ncbi:MAG: mandelate racemase/muconate lactonizing enzyme family protein [Planctomycetes bacterium]|nr:mandelate racemase/muconate lactonizing enzyme family protein [Planctomycetota bacterium]